MNPRYLISLTSVPPRFRTSLLEAVAALERQSLQCPILVCIPGSYRKWDAVEVPSWLKERERVIVYRPKMDYGPATKLLGALEYIRERPEVEYVITMDDDQIPNRAHYLKYIASWSELFPGCAITIGGIKLTRPFFQATQWLTYRNKFKFVDAPAGFKGVLYPANLMRGSHVPFDLAVTLPPGTFHEDDAYLAFVLSVMGIPLFAIPRMFFSKVIGTEEGKRYSAVGVGNEDRGKNEAELFRRAIELGYLSPNPLPGLRPIQRLRIMAHFLRFAIGGVRVS